MDSPRVKHALISVSDKSGLVEFAQGLTTAGVTLYSTGGTRRHLEEAGIAVQDISDYTGFPEMMDGRLKTLHPKVAGGLLARHDRADDMEALATYGIVTFELVVVNLYPFEQTIAKPGVTDEQAIEQIDIGGPTMVRAAAKNHHFVTLATDAAQYPEILHQVQTSGSTTLALRRELAGAAFERTATYDRAIANYFVQSARETANATGPQSETEAEACFPPVLTVQAQREQILRYGENPHQRAALYSVPSRSQANVVRAKKLHGKELSYNNLLDLDSALAIARSFTQAAAVVIKHNNPCGAAVGSNLADATRRAFAGDPVSAFGSVLGFNQEVDAATAEYLSEPGLFVEAIVAPSYSVEAVEILTSRPKWKANVRLLATGPLTGSVDPIQPRAIEGGLLWQEADIAPNSEAEWKNVTTAQASEELLEELRFAWNICRFVKSNAIVLGRECALVGVGAGQMSRVDSVEISIRKAGERTRGAVLASDAFFPFDDSIHQAAAAGIAALIQPGGSKRDEEVIAACNEHGLPMIFTGRRHFKH